MSRKTVHLICNAHLDPVWQWEWEEGLGAALSTFRTAADFCEVYDGFVFNHNEAVLYQWTEEYDPHLFERIRQLVAAGKWRVMGGWFLQPDCNMPSGESFVRQVLIGRRYFKEKFGVEPRTAVNFDPFGHNRGLVQILAKSGYDSYLFCRPGGDDLPLESEQFVWVGFDGSEVLAARLAGYHSIMGHAKQKVENDIKFREDQTVVIAAWGIGNHGGGPSRQDLLDLTEMIADRDDLNMKHSTPDAYFADLAKTTSSLPRRADDLNSWAVGCYTSQIRIKQKHRLLENDLFSTEKMATAAALQGLIDYPRGELNDALLDLLFSEFHDVLPGSSVQPVEESSLRRLDHGLETVSRVKTRSAFALAAGQKKAAPGEAPILVYNPHPFPVNAVIECELQLPDQNWSDEFTATPVYRDGAPLPYQNEKEAGNLTLDWRKRVVFAAELEPSAMNRFDCRYQTLKSRPEPSLRATGPEIVFNTPDLQVVINTHTGLIDRYRVHGTDHVRPNSFQPVVMIDDEDSWGMCVRSFRKPAGHFHLMSEEDSARFSGVTARKLPAVRVVEDGEVRSVVEVAMAYGTSAICMRYHLPKKGAEIEVFLRVFWQEKDRMLKLSAAAVK